jgi:hypothetical protein
MSGILEGRAAMRAKSIGPSVNGKKARVRVNMGMLPKEHGAAMKHTTYLYLL